MVRLATQDDVKIICQMFIKFQQESGYEAKTNFNKLPVWVSDIIDHDDFLVLLAEEDSKPYGMFIGQVAGSPYCDDIAAVEHSWYVEPDSRGKTGGVKLLKAYEYWAMQIKEVDHLTMICLDQLKDLGPFYEKMGYIKAESTYYKRTF